MCVLTHTLLAQQIRDKPWLSQQKRGISMDSTLLVDSILGNSLFMLALKLEALLSSKSSGSCMDIHGTLL